MPSLNISGLNTALSELKYDASYAFIAPLDKHLIELIQTILCTVDEHIFLISPQVDVFFDSDTSNSLYQLYQEEKLHPFNLNLDVSPSKKLRFTRGLLNELKDYPAIKNSALIVHLSSQMLEGYETQELKEKLAIYKKFAALKNATIMFVISGATNSNLRSKLLILNDMIDGLLSITQEASVYTFEYDFWHHSQGVEAKQTINFQYQNEQFVVLNEAEEQTSDSLYSNVYQDVDEDNVWVVKSAIPAGTKLPSFFQMVDDNDTLYQQALKMKAATLVFAVTRYTDLSLLAKECFALRKQCGRKLKLVIQNVDGIIRHQDECLFLTLGVNLILYSFSEPSRLLSQIQSIQGFKFSRPLPNSIDDVLKHTDSILSKGYLPLKSFANAVNNHSDSAANLGVSGVLVIMELLPRIEPINPLQLFHVKREGDIFSYVDSQVYLYLHACREHDVDNAIKHLFKLGIADFFLSKNVIADHFYIQQTCRQLLRQYESTQVPDFTEQLKGNVRYIFDANTADLANNDTAVFKKIVRPISKPVNVVLKGEMK